jgi:hypothetical protein
MKTSRYREAQIIVILRKNESAVPVAQLCCEQCVLLKVLREFRGSYNNGLVGPAWRASGINRRRRDVDCRQAENFCIRPKSNTPSSVQWSGHRTCCVHSHSRNPFYP